MTGANDISQLLYRARSERSGQKALAFLQKALEACKEWSNSEANPDALLFEAQTRAELAIELAVPAQRATQWRTALALLKNRVFSSPDLQQSRALAFASIAVDSFQDRYSSQAAADQVQHLRNAERYLTDAIALTDRKQAGTLLVRKSSVLRHLASTELTKEANLGKIRESKRCVELAATVEADAGTLLEVALVGFALARYENTDEAYADQLRKAESILAAPPVSVIEIGRLAYVRFLRNTYRPLDACDAFAQCFGSIENLRRVLRESALYAEAAISLWFHDTPSEILRPHLLQAKDLMETAIAGGYRDARSILGLAYLSAILEGPQKGELVLLDIFPSKTKIDWNRVAELATEQDGQDFVTQGFVLGMDQSATWSQLGTYAKRFLDDSELAETLYRAAVRVDPHDPVAMTNLARLLIEKNDVSELSEAERWVQKAQNLSDRRFTWWRPLLIEIERRKGPSTTSDKTQGSKVGKPLKSIRQVRQQFRLALNDPDQQQRGYRLEYLVYELAKLTFGLAAPAYEIKLDRVGVIKQVDGYFEHRVDKYRVECRWRSEKASLGDIDVFLGKLDVAWISGLFISMAGFTGPAVERARELRLQRAILLMDGNETKFLFDGHILFDDLISRKRLYFDQRSDPYYKVIPTAEAI